MSDPTPAHQAIDSHGEGDEAQLGLSLSELLGEIWSPARRQAPGDEDTAAPGGPRDPETGEPTTWNL
jgi:hypothetical protein